MARSIARCPVCKKPAKQTATPTGDHNQIDCPDCGRFLASESFSQAASAHSISAKRLALEHARFRARYGTLPVITTYDLP